jgi:hypothetical protein
VASPSSKCLQGRSCAAIDQFNGKEVGGRALKVNEAKPRENRRLAVGRWRGNRAAAAAASAAIAAAVRRQSRRRRWWRQARTALVTTHDSE